MIRIRYVIDKLDLIIFFLKTKIRYKQNYFFCFLKARANWTRLRRQLCQRPQIFFVISLQKFASRFGSRIFRYLRLSCAHVVPIEAGGSFSFAPRHAGAVQQEKMARFLALFLTAAYERMCRGHGSGCGARANERETLRRVAFSPGDVLKKTDDQRVKHGSRLILPKFQFCISAKYMISTLFLLTFDPRRFLINFQEDSHLLRFFLFTRVLNHLLFA